MVNQKGAVKKSPNESRDENRNSNRLCFSIPLFRFDTRWSPIEFPFGIEHIAPVILRFFVFCPRSIRKGI